MIESSSTSGITQYTKGCRLALKTLPEGAREAQILQRLAHSYLSSIGNFFDSGCAASVNQHTMAVTKDKQVVLQGTMGVMTGLWRITLHSLDRPTHHINNLHQVNDKENAIKYPHAEAFNPIQDTWAISVDMGYFNTWPGLTEK